MSDSEDSDRDVSGVEPGKRIELSGRVDELAPIARRGAGAVIDWLVYFFLATVMTAPFASEGVDGELVVNRWAYLGWVLVVAAIETIGVAGWGKTPGKLFVGIKVVSMFDGDRPRLLWSFLRVAPVVTALVVVPYPFYLAVIASLYLSAMGNEQQRSLLDRLARTIVVMG